MSVCVSDCVCVCVRVHMLSDPSGQGSAQSIFVLCISCQMSLYDVIVTKAQGFTTDVCVTVRVCELLSA